MLTTLVGRVVSIIGESPDTVMVSDKAPSRMLMSSVSVIPARITMPSRRNVEKPESSAVSTYGPGGRFRMRYTPSAPVVVVTG